MNGTPSTIPKASRSGLARFIAAFGWLLVAVYFAVATLVLVLRYWILPDVGQYRPEIEQAISRALGERVSIGGINARWQGLHPELDLSEVSIHDKEGRVALSLPAVEAIIGWRSLLLLSLRLHSLAIDQPDLDIRRDSSGRIFVAGVELRSDRSEAGAGDWLLAQSEIVVRNARLSWTDERRGAPTLGLAGVTLMLQNAGDSHRFALRAQTNPELASALDIRGEYHGDSILDIDAWRGRIFAELDFVDLAAWKQWVDYPLDLVSGKGALRLWMSTDGERVTEVNADVALANVRARLAEDLPMLDLEYLHGRLGGSRGGAKSERPLVRAHGSQLTLKSARGNALPPADFSLLWEGAATGVPERGELQANSLDFEPLANLAEFLPFPKAARADLVRVAPRGSVNDLKFSWTGDLEKPASFSVRGRFSKVDLKAPGGWGSFSGLSGELDANKSGGSLRINSENTIVDLPEHFPEGRAQFDKLAAQIGWTAADEHLDIKFSNVTLANSDGSAILNGNFSTRSRHAKSPGVLDLTAQFPRVDAKAVYRYIPHLAKSVREFLKQSLVAGQGIDGRLRLKGDLEDFPYANEKAGIFRVSARVANGEFRIDEAWPAFTDVAADLSFDGRRMQIAAQRASVLGARATNVRVQIPDLFGGDERVLVEGQGEGASAEFLRFIEMSPVTGLIDGATNGIRAAGAGRLQLKLDIPVRRLAQTKVTGAYQILANQVDIEGGVPPLNQVNGRIEFSESGLTGRGITAQLLGGSATFALNSRANGGVEVEAQGSAGIEPVRKFFEVPMLDRAGGSTNWRANVRAARDGLDVVVESTLVGVSIALPEPFSKGPLETLPFKLEYSNRADAEFLRSVKAPRLATGMDAFSVSLGSRASGVLTRRKTASGYQLDRGAVGVGEQVPPLDRPGIFISGRLAHLDADRWRSVLGSSTAGEGIATNYNLNLTVAALDFAGRRLNEVRLRVAPVGSAWAANVVSRELSGLVTWRPEGAGRVVARLKHFTVPDAPPGPLPPEVQSTELPALDIVSDSFTLGERQLGRLELVAVNEVRDWRIEKLTLTTEEGSFSANGVWQSWAQRPSVSLNMKLDLKNAGGFLTRMGFPGTMKDGVAKMEGKIGWLGNPQSIDYPTLTGDVTLNATDGQFLKADPGIAKLLGILSMQTWITLDFRGLFGEGFVFDTVASNARITRGVLATENFAMNGKTAKVSMAGTVNLAQETQNLKVRVVPSLGDGVSSIAALTVANPAIGLIALLVQRVLGDPVGKIFAFDYTVLGTWSDPKVARTNIETPVGSLDSKSVDAKTEK
ncbi:MAG: TIGR02099 family protein [Betaproteobacteria bacterium]|nr:TIGR02099 family protein [Betaproteobacteria bacterium]